MNALYFLGDRQVGAYDALLGVLGLDIRDSLKWSLLGKQSTMAYYGIGVEPWGIMFGMIIANTIGTPAVDEARAPG